MSRLGLRLRLMLAVSAAVAVALIALVSGFNLILGHVLDRDASDLVRTRALAQLDSLRIDSDRLSVGETQDDRSADAYLWIFAGRRPVERPRVSVAIDRAARALATAPPRARFVDVGANETRL